jgi:hypothetical protein
MIILEDQEAVILTPPRTASEMLHRLLCRRKNSYWVCSTDPHGYQNRHSTDIPLEWKTYKRYIVVRNPWQRLLGLYEEHNRFRKFKNKPPWTFTEYLDRRSELSWRHTWTQAHWAQGLEIDGVIHHDSIPEDLKTHLNINARVPIHFHPRTRWKDEYKMVDYDRLCSLYVYFIEDLIYGYEQDAITPIIARTFTKW